jgi:type I restriction enzyme M protein
MYTVVSEHVFPWLRTLGGNGTTYSKHMEGARFTIPTPALLAKVVDMIDKVPMEDRDVGGFFRACYFGSGVYENFET